MRAGMCCTLPDFPRARWTGVHVPALNHVLWTDGESVEPHNTGHEGCPRAWQVCGFARSVGRFRRRRVMVGEGYWIRESNPTLDACADDLVHEAVRYLESIETVHVNENEVAIAQQRAADTA